MLYRPADGTLWDTFLMRHDEWFHLFHLRGDRPLGHARSRDLLHWEARPTIDLSGPAGAWNENGPYWTGCIVHHQGTFHMLAGGQGPDGIACYGLFESDDLDRWEQVSSDAVLSPRLPHYRREPSGLHFMHAAWRDPCVLRTEDGWYHGFLCARSPEWSADDTGAVVAHVRSRDLRDWEQLPPLVRLGDRVVFAEVPDVFPMGEWWYVLFLDHGWGGVRINSPARADAAGTFYVRSRSLQGPYEWPDEPLLIGGSDDRVGPWAARTLSVGDERWLYFHNAGGEPAFGLPKGIEQAPNGDLWLRYLPITEPVETPVRVDTTAAVGSMKPRDPGRWTESDGVITGSAGATGSAILIADGVRDGVSACRITGDGAARAGMVVRSSGAPGRDMFEQDNRGIAVWLDFERQCLVADRCTWVPGFGWGRSVHDQMGWDRRPRATQQVRCTLPSESWLHLRVCFRDRFLEAYLDDRWVLTLNTDDHVEAGRVELAVERGRARFGDLTVASLPPLDAARADD